VYILFSIVYHFAEHEHYGDLWVTIAPAVQIFQGLAALEIFHSLLGIVKTPVATTLVQVFSRVALVFITTIVPDTPKHWAVTLMVTSWAITEVVRYLYYALNQNGKAPYWLGWLRYTLFLVLYPSGVSGEVGTIIVSLDYVKSSGWILLYYALIASFPAYLIGFPWLFYHMLGQRKRFLSGSSGKPANKKKAH